MFLASLCSYGDWFESRFVGNPEDRFCRIEAQLISALKVASRHNWKQRCQSLGNILSTMPLRLSSSPFDKCASSVLFNKFPFYIFESNAESITPDRRQSKTLILSTSVDKKSLETEFSTAICRPNGDKWQSKTLFLSIFDSRQSIGKSLFDCRQTV